MTARLLTAFPVSIGVGLLTMAFQAVDKPAYELNGKTLTVPMPFEYREWVHVGHAVIPDDQNQGRTIFPGIHNVYMEPNAYQFKMERGVFRDGTIIVMEVQHLRAAEGESGYGYFTTGGIDILVQIKDRRAQEDGDGWMYFVLPDKEFKAGKKQVTLQEPRRCRSCHQAAAKEDQVFIQYYPALERPDYQAQPAE